MNSAWPDFTPPVAALRRISALRRLVGMASLLVALVPIPVLAVDRDAAPPRATEANFAENTLERGALEYRDAASSLRGANANGSLGSGAHGDAEARRSSPAAVFDHLASGDLSSPDAGSAAANSLGRGVQCYFDRRGSDAERNLTDAIRAGSRDPLAYYFRGLNRLRLGFRAEAQRDIFRGAQLEARRSGDRQYISQALTRIQGPARATIETYRRQALQQASARASRAQQSSPSASLARTSGPNSSDEDRYLRTPAVIHVDRLLDPASFPLASPQSLALGGRTSAPQGAVAFPAPASPTPQPSRAGETPILADAPIGMATPAAPMEDSAVAGHAATIPSPIAPPAAVPLDIVPPAVEVVSSPPSVERSVLEEASSAGAHEMSVVAANAAEEAPPTNAADAAPTEDLFGLDDAPEASEPNSASNPESAADAIAPADAVDATAEASAAESAAPDAAPAPTTSSVADAADAAPTEDLFGLDDAPEAREPNSASNPESAAGAIAPADAVDATAEALAAESVAAESAAPDAAPAPTTSSVADAVDAAPTEDIFGLTDGPASAEPTPVASGASEADAVEPTDVFEMTADAPASDSASEPTATGSYGDVPPEDVFGLIDDPAAAESTPAVSGTSEADAAPSTDVLDMTADAPVSDAAPTAASSSSDALSEDVFGVMTDPAPIESTPAVSGAKKPEPESTPGPATPAQENGAKPSGPAQVVQPRGSKSENRNNAEEKTPSTTAPKPQAPTSEKEAAPASEPDAANDPAADLEDDPFGGF